MATVDTENIPELTFDVNKFSITTTPPSPHQSNHKSNQSKYQFNQSNSQLKEVIEDNDFKVVLETAEYDDHAKHRSGHSNDSHVNGRSTSHSNANSIGHAANDQKSRTEKAESSDYDEDREPKEHSASKHNNQVSKHTHTDSDTHSIESDKKSNQSERKPENQVNHQAEIKPSEPVNDIEAAKARAHAERVARKAAKEAKKAAKKGSKDDSSLQQPRNNRVSSISASAPNSPVDSPPGTQLKRKLSVDRSLSKHKLLAPPPIKSSRNNLADHANGSVSPMTPSSPYVPPTHPKRKNQPHPNTSDNRIFGWEWTNVLDRSLEFVVGKNMAELRAIAPKTLLQHPYVMSGLVVAVTMIVIMKSLGIRLLAPLLLISSLLSFAMRHSYISLSILTLVLTLWAIRSRRSLVRLYQSVFLPPMTDSFPDCFEYEEIQLADQPKELVTKWAREIDQYTPVEDIVNQSNNQVDPDSVQSPTANTRDTLPHMYSRMSGTAALSLMQCYQQGDLEDCEFHCLRVYSKDASFVSSSATQSNNNIERDNDDTMGFVFISIKKHYDVSPTLLKIFTPIQVCFPWLCLPALWSQRIRRIMTFRFGVIGFHWPFRSAVFFTKPVIEFKSALELDTNSMAHLVDAESTNEQNEAMIIQVARTASFISIARKFDSSRPASERCDFLLYTVASASPVVNAITASGGAALPILPTYVADLRPVKGQDWQAYKRHLRHQNRKVREGPFENAGGHADLVSGNTMGDEDADNLVDMWHKVAGFRSSRDATSCLMAPTVKFIHELTHHEGGFVDFLALKLNQTVVAASLLFSLGPEVLTSDVAGFNYDALEEAGRKANQQIKAYPVKLAAVIKHGIANGYEYVDFGPTTGPSKMELGCREISLMGGLFYHGTLTSIVVSLAACAATSRHTVASR